MAIIFFLIVLGYFRHSGVVLLFIALAFVFTFPLLLNFNTMLLGAPGDNMLWLELLGWYAKSYDMGFPKMLNDTQVFYPLGHNIMHINGFSLDGFLAIPLIFLGGYIFAYNLISLLSLALSAFTAYLLAYEATKSRLASILGGVVFGFGTFQMVHALGHFSIFGPFWLPLFVLYLERTIKNPTPTRALLTGVFFVLTSITNGYLGVIAVLLLVIITVIHLLQTLLSTQRSKLKSYSLASWIRRVVPSLVAFAAPLLLLVPIFIYASAGAPKWTTSEFEFYSADSIDYISPSMLNPVFGKTVLALRTFNYGNPVERSLFLGIIPLVLTIYALMQKRDPLRIRYSLVALLFFIFSLGPILHVADQNTGIQMPYAFLMTLPLLNFARVVSRFGVVPLLCVSLLSSIGLNDWLRRLSSKGISIRKQKAIGLFIIGLVIFEFYPGAYPFTDIEFYQGGYPLTDPHLFDSSVYFWLSEQKGDFAILEYPVTHTDILAGYHVLISGKSTVSGLTNVPSKALSDYLLSVSFFQPDDKGNFSQPIDIPLLKKLNIRFILFHKDAYMAAFGEQTLIQALVLANMTEGLRYIGDFDGTVVYEITKI